MFPKDILLRISKTQFIIKIHQNEEEKEEEEKEEDKHTTEYWLNAGRGHKEVGLITQLDSLSLKNKQNEVSQDDKNLTICINSLDEEKDFPEKEINCSPRKANSNSDESGSDTPQEEFFSTAFGSTFEYK
mmetsp:Transcript_31538/g.27929  ORF Transcript_31538/g.27929 Transcript_31538/m.27929 type:complete len:130 (+) Transcript_31538:663-1052(+)